MTWFTKENWSNDPILAFLLLMEDEIESAEHHEQLNDAICIGYNNSCKKRVNPQESEMGGVRKMIVQSPIISTGIPT